MRIGIDLGGTTVKAALCAPDGTLLHKQSAPTPTGDAGGLCAAMKQLALGLCAAQGAAPEQITSIGIGVPGSFDKATCTLKFLSLIHIFQMCSSAVTAMHSSSGAPCGAAGQSTLLTQYTTSSAITAGGSASPR